MKYRRVGASELLVSEISLGSWLTLGQLVDPVTSRQCVRAALDAGINFFDTADVYGMGMAEQALRSALADVPRRRLLIGTKCFFPTSEASADRGLSRKHVIASVEKSLRNLGIETLDLMQCHRFDPETPLEETVRAMDDLARAGKIRYWGVSRWSPEQIERAMNCSAGSGRIGPIADQLPYSLLYHNEEEAFGALKALTVGVLIYSPLAQGVLSGKYGEGEPPPGTRATSAELRRTMWAYDPQSFAKVARLHPIAAELGVSLAQLALAWCLRRDVVSTAICGASSPGQILSNAAASEVTLSEEALDRIDAAIDARSAA